jgi:hypothetical protein
VTFPSEIVRTLTPSDAKFEMSSEYVSSVPKCCVSLCEGPSHGKGGSMNRDYLWRKPLTSHDSVPKNQVESMDAI